MLICTYFYVRMFVSAREEHARRADFSIIGAFMLSIRKLFIEMEHVVVLTRMCIRVFLMNREQKNQLEVLRKHVRENLIESRACARRQRGEAIQEGRYVG